MWLKFYKTSVAKKLFFTAFFMVILCCFAMFVAMLYALIAYPNGLQYIQMAMSAPSVSSVGVLKVFQSAQSIGLFVLPALVMAYLFEDEGLLFLKLKHNILPLVLLLSALLVFACCPIINVLASFNQKLQLPESMSALQDWIVRSERNASELTNLFLFADSYAGLLVNMLVMAVLPAIGEEMLFRGVLQQYCIKLSKNEHVGIWITAIVFSAFHMQFLGFLPRVFLGLVLGYLFFYTKNLWYPIVFHFVNNGMSVLFFYYKQQGTSNLNPDKIGLENDQQWMVLTSLFLIGVILYFVRKLNSTEVR
jgi:membrane protease YdiL (CAAX protease family)